ncbi:MAG: DnaJ domain-containing protein [Bacteroidales bacterium]|jgi:thiamine pyrophosphate-dependent acetolactate synthase large subunit-like protein
MTLTDYYEILGLPVNSTIEEIKKAYRKKARLYHPDINPAPDAKDHFISITEAYEFLIANHEKIKSDDQAYHQAMEDWRKYRQDRSRKRATVYARTSYGTFKNTRFYKTTRIFDGTTIIFSFVISIMVLIYTIYGYIFRLNHPLPGLEKPSVFVFIMLLVLGMIFFVVSFIYLKAYLETSRKQKKKS